MLRKYWKVIVLLLLTILILLSLVYSIGNSDIDISNIDSDTIDTATDNPGNNTSKIKKFEVKNIGSDNRGDVELIGPFGNPKSKVKIAYIIGVHPAESFTHETVYDILSKNNENLKYTYYIYKVNVNDKHSQKNGRLNGQNLSSKYIVPDVIKKDYDLVVDFHSNQGQKGSGYEKVNFIFAPLNQNKSKELGDRILSKIPDMDYYFPPTQTSTKFIAIPIMNSGKPTLVFETYEFQEESKTIHYVQEIIDVIDNLNF